MNGRRWLVVALILLGDLKVAPTREASAGWYRVVAGTAPASLYKVAVSTAGAPGKWRVYGIAGTVVQEFEWWGSSFTRTALPALPTTILGIAAGPAQSDGKVRLYAGTIGVGVGGSVYELTYSAGWTSRDLGPPVGSGSINDVAVGVGRGDGVTRVYAAHSNGIMYEYTVYATSATITSMGGPGAFAQIEGVAAGAGRAGSATNYVYGVMSNDMVEEWTYSAGWTLAMVGSVGSGSAGLEIAIGPGRGNAAGNRVYASASRSAMGIWTVTEFSYSSPMWSSVGVATMTGTAVGGVTVGQSWKTATSTEVFFGGASAVALSSWTGSGWGSTETLSATTTYGVDGNREGSVRGDGIQRVYGAGGTGGVLSEYRYDGVLPVSSITAPNPGAWNSLPTISGTVSDNHGVKKLGLGIRKEVGAGEYWTGAGWSPSYAPVTISGPWDTESTVTYPWSYSGVSWVSNSTYTLFTIPEDLAQNSAGVGHAPFLFDNLPPAAVANLVADRTGAVEGQLRITWTRPGDGSDGVVPYGGLSGYVVKYATTAITSQAEFNAATSVVQSWTPVAPGGTETRYLTGLTAGTTYYLAVEARDTATNQAALSNPTSAWAQYDVTPPAAVTNLLAEQEAQVRLTWTSTGDDGTAGTLTGSYLVRYSSVSTDTADTAPFQAGASFSSVPGSAFSLTLTGLRPRTTHYFWIRLQDERANRSLWSSTASAVATAFIRGQGLFGLQEQSGTADPSVALGDWDNDGDLDMAVIGADSPTGPHTRVFRNDAGTYIRLTPELVGLLHGAAAFADMDRDGDLDLAVAGYNVTVTPRRFLIYRNDGGAGQPFVLLQEPLGAGAGLEAPSLAFGDVDRDGDPDLVASGYDGTSRRLLVYRNDGLSGFVLIQQPLAGSATGLYNGSLALGDLDNDGDLDLVAQGMDGAGTRRLLVYRNDLPPAGFVLLQQPLGAGAGLVEGAVALGDADLDGDLDLAAAGHDGATPRLLYYRNDGSSTAPFNLAQQPLGAGAGLAVGGSLAFADMDNGGNLDLVAAGSDGTMNRLLLFNNDGGGVFSIAQQPFGPLDGIRLGGAVPGDVDGDGDLDLVVMGTSAVQGARLLQRYTSLESQFANANVAPTAPSEASSTETYPDAEAGVMRVTWPNGGDTEGTDPDRLYYQARMGSSPGGRQRVSDRYGTPLLGGHLRPRVGTQNAMRLIPIEGTTVYWAVRTIDAGLRRSAENGERTYFVSSGPAVVTSLSALPGGPEGSVTLTWTAPGDDGTLGTAATYLVRYATVSIIPADWSAAWVRDVAPLSPVPAPAVGGSSQSMTVTGLSEGVTYYFALRARDEVPNESPVSNSPGAPATVVYPVAPSGAGASSPGTGNRLNLSWTANTETDLKDYGIYRATYSPVVVGAGLLTRPAAPGTTHQDGGLANGTTYYYRLTARDTTLHESGGSAEASGRPEDTTPPAPPVGPVVSVVPAGGRLALSWSTNTETDLKDYRLWRATASPVGIGGAFSPAAAIAAPGATHQDGGLTDGTTFYYRLTARDATGNESGGSSEISGLPRDTTPPPAPSGPGAASPGTGQRLNLSWSAVSDESLKDYGVYRATFSTSLSGKILVARVATPGTTRQDPGLANGTTYYYQVTARDTALNESGGSAEQSGTPQDTAAPATPTGLGVADVPSDQGGALRLSWAANPESDLKDYRVRRATFVGVGAADPVVAAVAAPGTTHQDAGLAANTTYYYRLAARDASLNESGLSAEAGTYPADDVAPGAPVGLAASSALGGAAAGGRLTLTWTTNPESDLKDYGVYRATWAGASPAPAPARIAAPGTTHQDAGLADGATYYYRLKARDLALNESGYSTEVSAYPADTQAPGTPTGFSVSGSTNMANVSWVANAEGDLKDYRIWRSTNAGVTLVSSHTMAVMLAPGTTHRDLGLTNETTYYYRLTARDAVPNESGGSAEVSALPTTGADTTPPATPAGLGAAVVATGQRLNLSWTANGESDLKDYGVYRATSTPVVVGATFQVARVVSPGTTRQDAGLVNGTTYYYRLTARDTSGNESGGSAEASGTPQDTTPPAAPAGVGVANPGTGQRLNLSWTANTESDLKDYGVYRATFVGAGLQAGPAVRIAAPGTTHQDRGLTNEATYYFRLTARDATLNESAGSGEVSAYPADTTAPDAPSGAGVSSPGTGQRLDLSWAANTEGDLKDYGVYRATFVGAGLQAGPAVRIAAPGTTHQDQGLTNGATYYFRLTARDVTLNESAGSTEVSAYPTDIIPPAAPSGAGASSPGTGQRLNLSWTANPEGDLKDYRVYRAAETGGLGGKAVVASVAQPGTTHQDAGLANGTTYFYQLTARDVSGNESSGSAEFSGTPQDTAPPASPSGLGAANVGTGNRLRLSWTANTEPDLKDYRLWRATASPVGIGGAFSPAAVIAAPGTTHQDSGLTDGATFYYRLTARDVSLNESGGSPEASGVPADTTPPAAPTTLTVSATAGGATVGGRLSLSWSAVSDDALKDYRIYRATSIPVVVGATFLVARVVSPGTTHQDAGLTDETTFYYRVTARDTILNESGGSPEVSGLPRDTAPPAAPATMGAADPATGGALHLSWSANTETDLKDYGVYRATFTPVVVGAAFQAARVVSPGTTHQDTGLANGTTYYYRVTARDIVLNESGGSPEASGRPTDASFPATPTGLGASNAGPGNRLNLSWTTNTEPDLKDYRLWRATYSPVGIGGAFSPAAVIAAPGTTHQDAGLTDGTTYYYQVTARDTSLNESVGSDEVSAVPSDITPPAAPGSLGATDPATGARLRLSWAGVTDEALADYRLYRSTNAGVTLVSSHVVTAILAPGTTHEDNDLVNGTTSYYRVTARDASLNESSGSPEASGRPTDAVPPAIPTGVGVANEGTGNLLVLSWTANTEPDIKDYGVYRATWAGASPAPTRRITFIASPGTTHQDGGLTDETTYYFRLTARDTSLNESPGSAEVSALPRDTIPPATIGDLAFSTSTAVDSITLTWTAPGDDGTLGQVAAYRIRRATYAVGVDTTSWWNGATAFLPGFAPAAPGAAEARAVTGLAEDTTYYLTVRGEDARANLGGMPSAAIGKTKDQTAPSALTNLSAAPGTANGTVVLTWTAPGDNGTSGRATAYVVKYATSSISTQAAFITASTYVQAWAPLPQGTTESQTLAGLAPGTTYFFAIEALDEEGNQATLSNVPSAPATAVGIHHFDITNLSTTTTAGNGLTFTLTARTAANTVLTDYTGTVTFSATDPQATVPPDTPFTPPDGGVRFFSGPLFFRTAGGQRLVVQDSLLPAASGQSAIVQVSSGAFSQFRVTGLPQDPWAHVGRVISPAVEAVDAFGNRRADYTGTIVFDARPAGAATLPGGTTAFGPQDAGRLAFTNGIVFQINGVPVTDLFVEDVPPTVLFSTRVSVAALSSFRFRVSGLPSPITAGTPGSVTVEALTPVNTRYTAYQGTARFASTDGKATLPADSPLAAGDLGVKTLANGVVLKTAGVHTVTVEDPASADAVGKMTGSQSGITVLASAPLGTGSQPAVDHFVVEFLDANGNVTTTIPADQAIEIRVTARDPYENLIPGFNGTVQIGLSSGRITPSVVTLQNGGPPPGTRALVRIEAGRDGTVRVTVNGQPARTATGGTLTIEVPATAQAKTSVGYPNPFDPAAGPAMIRFYMDEPAEVRLQIFTLTGEQVREWTFQADRGSQYHLWDGTNGSGLGVASDGYLVLIEKRYPGGAQKETVHLAVLRR